MTGLVSTCNAG